jgi:hypothetical protein
VTGKIGIAPASAAARWRSAFAISAFGLSGTPTLATPPKATNAQCCPSSQLTAVWSALAHAQDVAFE